jgi:dTMP kinase
MNNGKLIIFEGMECCGKGTQIKKIVEYLESKNKNVIIAKEPGQTEVGKKIREILLQTDYIINPVSQAFLLNACRADIYEKIIKPEISKGSYIIQDRSWPSTIVYQVYAGGLDLNTIETMVNFAIDKIMPDLVFYLYIPFEKYPEVFEERIAKRNEELTSFEKNDMNYFHKVFNGYEYLADKYPDT